MRTRGRPPFIAIATLCLAGALALAACSGDDDLTRGDGGLDGAPGTSDASADASATGDAASSPADAGALLTMTGTTGGVSLVAADGTSSVEQTDGGTTNFGRTRFIAAFGDKPNMCTLGFLRQNATIFLLDVESPETSLAPGVFPMRDATHTAPPYVLVAQLVAQDAQCKPAPDRSATAGSVTITAAGATRVDGTYDLSFPDGRITGSFSVPVDCADVHGTCAP